MRGAVVESPKGIFDAPPRVITALVPAGASGFVVTLVDDAGATVYRMEAKPGERGCFVEPAELEGPGGRLRVGRLLVPFPDAAEFPMAPERPYGVVVAIAGGHASASSVVQLHAAPRETR